MISQFVSSDKLKKKEAHEFDHQLKKKKNDNSNITSKKDKSTISSTESNKLDTPSISPEVNIQKIQTIPYKSNSVIFVDSLEKQKTHYDNNGKEDKTRNEESLKSLKSMDINCVLSRIDFNFEENTNHITKQPETQNKNNGFNDMFSDDFFNFIPTNNQQVVQFTDFTVQNNENSSNNTLNRSQSLYNKQPANNKKSIVITQMFDKKKYQSPDILHNQQQNISDMKKSEGPINSVNQNTTERDNETQLSSFLNNKFNINHSDNKPIQSIDLTTLNIIGVKEDVFDLNEIKRQLRCSIIVC